MNKEIRLLLLLLSLSILVGCNDKQNNDIQVANTEQEKWEWEEEKSNKTEKTVSIKKEEEPAQAKILTKKEQPAKYPVAVNSKKTTISGNKVDININLTITLDVKDLKKGKSISITADAKPKESKEPQKVQVAKVTKMKELAKPVRDITKTIPSIIKKKEETPKKMESMSKPKEINKPMKMDKKSDSKTMSNMGGTEGMNMGGSSNPQMLNDTLKADGYVVNITSAKPLVVGDNNIEVTVTKDDKKITDAKVKVKFFMPEMPGMPYMEYNDKLKLKGDSYKGLINYSMNGTWQYNLKFKTSDDKIHKVRGSVNL